MSEPTTSPPKKRPGLGPIQSPSRKKRRLSSIMPQMENSDSSSDSSSDEEVALPVPRTSFPLDPRLVAWNSMRNDMPADTLAAETASEERNVNLMENIPDLTLRNTTPLGTYPYEIALSTISEETEPPTPARIIRADSPSIDADFLQDSIDTDISNTQSYHNLPNDQEDNTSLPVLLSIFQQTPARIPFPISPSSSSTSSMSLPSQLPSREVDSTRRPKEQKVLGIGRNFKDESFHLMFLRFKSGIQDLILEREKEKLEKDLTQQAAGAATQTDQQKDQDDMHSKHRNSAPERPRRLFGEIIPGYHMTPSGRTVANDSLDGAQDEEERGRARSWASRTTPRSITPHPRAYDNDQYAARFEFRRQNALAAPQAPESPSEDTVPQLAPPKTPKLKERILPIVVTPRPRSVTVTTREVGPAEQEEGEGRKPNKLQKKRRDSSQ